MATAYHLICEIRSETGILWKQENWSVTHGMNKPESIKAATFKRNLEKIYH